MVIPELVEDKWYEYFLHNQRGRLLEWVLLARGNDRIFTVSAPWYVGKRRLKRQAHLHFQPPVVGVFRKALRHSDCQTFGWLVQTAAR